MAKVRYMSVSEGERVGIFDYPNFHKSVSIAGMKKYVYGKDALLVRCGDWIYHVPADIYNKANLGIYRRRSNG